MQVLVVVVAYSGSVVADAKIPYLVFSHFTAIPSAAIILKHVGKIMRVCQASFRLYPSISDDTKTYWWSYTGVQNIGYVIGSATTFFTDLRPEGLCFRTRTPKSKRRVRNPSQLLASIIALRNTDK